MKAVETMLFEGKNLTTLVQTEPTDEQKTYISYFIDGIEITDFNKLKGNYVRLFQVSADNLCETYNLIKWSY